jgi:hypothetical protein
MLDQEAGGRYFREAWIAGVTRHFPGTPKSGYIVPWDEMGEWEQKAAIAVYAKTQAFILAGLHGNKHPTPEQGGRFISETWNVQVYRHIPNPKPGYVADWEDLPEWQRKTDMDIYSAIEAEVSRGQTVQAET